MAAEDALAEPLVGLPPAVTSPPAQDVDASAPLDMQLQAARTTLVDRLLLGASWMACALLPLLAWRAQDVGWHTQLQIQAAVLLITIALGVVRRRMPLRVKTRGMILCTTSIGLSGVMSLGMTGTGYFWLLLSAVFVAVFESFAAGIVAVALAGAVVGGAALGFVGGGLQLPIDLNAHALSASGWISFLVVITVVPMVVLYAAGGVQHQLLALLEKLREQRDQLEAQGVALERRASHDQLTGLPLIHLAADRLQMAIRAGRRGDHQVGLLFIDLDGFKAINDGHGHEAGDALLREVAGRLRSCVRDEDTVARIGGDEFIVILAHVASQDAALAVARDIVRSMDAPFHVDAELARVGASVGLALFPDHAVDADRLRRLADAAMYRAKRDGGGGVAVASGDGRISPSPG